MTDYGSFVQAEGFLSNKQSRSSEWDFASTKQELQSNNLVKRLSVTSFGNYSFCANQIAAAQLQLPHGRDVCTSNLEDVKPTVRRILETIIDDTCGVEKQTMNKWDICGGDVEDAEFARILANLPTSYDDFESKELHLKLERNFSSLLMARKTLLGNCGRVSVNSNLTKSSQMQFCDTGINPPDADDLEVAMINQSFEEQQKQTKLYASPGLKNLFYSQPNFTADSSVIKSSDKKAASNAYQSLKVVPESQNCDSSAGALLAANLLLTGVKPNAVVPNEFSTVASPWSIPQDNCENIREFGYKGGSFEETVFGDTSLHRASQEAFGNALAALKVVSDLVESQQERRKEPQDASSALASEDNMEATAALALNVVESLFDRSALTENEFSTKEESEDSSKISDEGECDAMGRNVHEMDVSNKSEDLKMEQEFSNMEQKNDEAVVMGCDAVDSWEELDNDDYSFKIIETAMCKMKIRKSKFGYPAQCAADTWDDDQLSHVLEGYNYPAQFTEADVKQELAKHDCADVVIHSVDDTHCLVVFASKTAALQAMIAVRQRQRAARVRLRSLRDATTATQQKARRRSEMLLPHIQRPQTTPLIARRIIEGVLGKRSNVSTQQINRERKQLQDAKDSKLAKTAVWEDGSY